jgi:MoxR-like ATPase
VGLFDFLNKKGAQTPVQKLAVKAADKRGMAPDRWEALQALSKIDSEEAVEALLNRFTFYVDPSITDQEEKDSVFASVVSKGQLAVAPLKRFLRKSESLSWPLKMLDRVLPGEQVLGLLVDILKDMDTEYERDPTRKLQVLAELEARRGEGVAEAVLPFLRDVNETARFHAVGALVAQESLEGCAQRGWAVDAAKAGKLPDGFAVDASGQARRR